MASVNTNAAAITALRTLQQTNSSLDATQNRISTGLRIGEAKDNAAYWAISVTLKSDNKSLGTVKDALGLGSATVDVAYQGLNKTKDVLDEIKAKLTAATQPGVDIDVIQSEISELQKQLSSIATSSVFSGENWLSVDSSTANYESTKKIVASFSRDANNSVAIGTVDVAIGSVALFDSNGTPGKDGVLDRKSSLKDATGRDLAYGGVSTATGNSSSGGLVASVTPAAGTGPAAATATTGTTPANTGGTGGGLVAGDVIEYSLTIDGRSLVVRASADNGTGTVSRANMAAALNANSAFSGVATATGTGATLTVLTNNAAGTTAVNSVTVYGADGHAKAVAGTGFTNIAQPATLTLAAASFSPFTLDTDDSIVFDLQVNDATGTKTVSIDQALVNKALAGNTPPVTNGAVATVGDYQKVLSAAFKVANVTNADVKTVGGDLVITTSDVAGTRAALAISKLNVSGGGRQVSVVNIDISTAAMVASGADTGDKIAEVLKSYARIVNTAINQVTTAASNLGAVASRIDMQKSFVNTLMDTIDKGVGGLIDADMSEESTKLQALQVKQQLGVQALSIANQSAQNIMQLFKS